MDKTFPASRGKEVVLAIIRTIQEHADYLSEIDGAIGDGDHGINMHKGFSLAEKRMEDAEMCLSDAFFILGNVLIEEIGGSMGPLYGRFFKRMAAIAKDNGSIDIEVFATMLHFAMDGIMALSEVKPGDKTLIDTLAPAVNSMEDSVRLHRDFHQAMDEMILAAHRGWQSTKDMIALVGRASRLGERSRGVLDAGATSCYFILESMGECMKEYAV